MSIEIKPKDIRGTAFDSEISDISYEARMLGHSEVADILNLAIKHGIVSPLKPPCQHWWSEEDHEWRNCTDTNGRDEHSEPVGFCPDCGGNVEIIEDPYKEGGAA